MTDTEAVLLRRFARGRDAEALTEIVRRHAGLVYSAALRILADVDRASDVAQETFLQLTKDAGNITGSLPGWLHRVATHKAIDQMRRDTSRSHRERQYVAGRPREATQWRDLSRYVDEGLQELDAETRDILVAHFLQGQTTRQIAGVRGISQATVSRRVDAGVTRLRGMLRQRGLLVAPGLLSLWLGQHAVQAAPVGLMAELGKMAILGGTASLASSSATGASIVETAVGVLVGLKTKAAVVAVVAAIGAGSVVTYRQAMRDSSDNIVITRSPTTRQERLTPTTSASVSRAPATAAGPSEAARKWNELIAGALSLIHI